MNVAEIAAALTGPAGKADPYPLYAELHELGEAVEVQPGLVFVVGYDAISSVLRNPAFDKASWASFDEVMPGWREHPALVNSADWILGLNAPEHTRIRSLMSRAFTPRRVAGLEAAIAEIADDLLDAMARAASGGAVVEFMHDFAYLLPVTVICELIGIPEADREGFRPLARDIAAIFEFNDSAALPRIDAASVALTEYFAGLVAARRGNPRDDLLSDLIVVSAAADGRLSDAELLSNLTLLLVAGFETTTNLLGNGLRIILDEPAVGEGIRDGSIQVDGFVEEVLRFDSPVQLTSRIGHGTELAGVAVPEWTEVITLIGAGNRDPRKFAEPETFRPGRAEGAPLSFGGGAHFCIGAALARLEAGVAFPRLLARFGSIAEAGQPQRRDGLVLRGFDALPVTLR
ncbi:MAG TPA: cytochrome P450 [Streptosporangiaceae bacterium]|jgi:cytochrome P450